MLSSSQAKAGLVNSNFPAGCYLKDGQGIQALGQGSLDHRDVGEIYQELTVAVTGLLLRPGLV